MTEQKKKACEFLGSVRAHSKRARRLLEQIEVKRYQLLPGAIRYDKDRVNASPRDQMLETFAQIDELERFWQAECAEVTKLTWNVFHAIMQIPKGPEQTFLLEYYINQKSMFECSDLLNYSLRHTYRLQKKAIDVFVEVHADGWN